MNGDTVLSCSSFCWSLLSPFLTFQPARTVDARRWEWDGGMVDWSIFGVLPFGNTFMNDRARFKSVVGADWCALIPFGTFGTLTQKNCLRWRLIEGAVAGGTKLSPSHPPDVMYPDLPATDPMPPVGRRDGFFFSTPVSFSYWGQTLGWPPHARWSASPGRRPRMVSNRRDVATETLSFGHGYIHIPNAKDAGDVKNLSSGSS
jgi:hypothetical protein